MFITIYKCFFLCDNFALFTFCIEIQIGFNNLSLSVDEGSGSIKIDVRKFPIGKTTEQNFTMSINAYQSLTTSEQLQMEYGISGVTFFQFSATEDKYELELNIRNDLVVENTKELILNIQPAPSVSAGSGICEKSSGCHSTVSIRITDDDCMFQEFICSLVYLDILSLHTGLPIGFTERNVEVLESAGKAGVCVSILNDTILDTYVFLVVETRPSGGAGNTIYFGMFARVLCFMNFISIYNTGYDIFDNYQVGIELDRANPKKCFDILIIDDNQVEDEETLDVILYQLETDDSFDRPLLNINPAIMTISVVDDDCKFKFFVMLNTVH